ncbi:helix-turn-helix domain-containing protein [Nonomuraea cavernae]|uniref:helix-turn-helix domain-containing protein n=1 Tax=Nonomuraea cavernae TaxID=2045107 RepID=UPI0033E63773
MSSIRKRRGLTQQELAALSGVSASLIRKIEQDSRKDIRLETARKLAAALRVPTMDVISQDAAEQADEPPADLWAPVRCSARPR